MESYVNRILYIKSIEFDPSNDLEFKVVTLFSALNSEELKEFNVSLQEVLTVRNTLVHAHL
ncbi:MAG: hypothetical protein CEO22_646, partial [Candidatus Berkelbacteria bacterium Gr01-1014_85]